MSDGEKDKNEDSPKKSNQKDETQKQNQSPIVHQIGELENDLKTIAEDIKANKPDEIEHQPYVYNTLGPYCSVNPVKHVTTETREKPRNRPTATGLVDPWVSLKKDQLEQEDISAGADDNESADQATGRSQKSDTRNQKKEKSEERPPKEGSTRLPEFPRVNASAGELANKKLLFSDVPMLRKELHEKYSANANEKIAKDYKRTKNDFYRMELDKLDEVRPISRKNLTATYFAYLQNTPGSKKALKECVRETKRKLEESEQNEENADDENDKDKPESVKTETNKENESGET